MTTARTLYHHCRKLGITLSADGDAVIFDAPPDVVVPVEDIRRLKTELLAMLRGEYVVAAMALLMTIPDLHEREMLADAFDERAGICQFDGNMSRGEAERAAYIELARRVESQDRQRSTDCTRQDPGDAAGNPA